MTCSRSGGEPIVARRSRRKHWSRRKRLQPVAHTEERGQRAPSAGTWAGAYSDCAPRLVKTIGEEDEDASRRVAKESLRVSVRDDKA